MPSPIHPTDYGLHKFRTSSTISSHTLNLFGLISSCITNLCSSFERCTSPLSDVSITCLFWKFSCILLGYVRPGFGASHWYCAPMTSTPSPRSMLSRPASTIFPGSRPPRPTSGAQSACATARSWPFCPRSPARSRSASPTPRASVPTRCGH